MDDDAQSFDAHLTSLLRRLSHGLRVDGLHQIHETQGILAEARLLQRKREALLDRLVKLAEGLE